MKKSKKNLSNRVGLKTEPKKHNPFEVRVNRQKYDVLGKKSKNEKGLPGISRSRAIKKRKATLLQDYKLKNKVNQFVDRRIGEQDKSMTSDDKILARYTTERMKFHSRKSLYNLDDNEVLTHRGESLAEIEKFEDPKSDEDDDDDETDGRNKSGKLDEQFVSDAHFGGGMLTKVDGENKSRKDLIDQMIADSKKRKAEKQKERERTLDLTEKLDTEWKDVMQLVASTKLSKNDDGVLLKSERKYASYDILSKELIFEARGKPTDKLKSEAVIAKEEKEKLDKLEKERLARMVGDVDKKKTSKHKSADDLDDGFDYNDFPTKKRKKQSESEDEVEEKIEESAESSENEESDDENESENNDEDHSDVDLSDLKDTDDECEEEETEKQEIEKTPSIKIDQTLDEIPFTLNIPESYEEFEELCSKREPDVLGVIVERMVKSNHPSLPTGSTAKLIKLFMYCLQLFQDLASNPDTKLLSFRALNQLTPWLYDIAQKAPSAVASSISDVIKEKYEDYSKRPRKFPSLDTFIFLKLVGILFPTSDYRHRIVTPSLVFMQQILATCRINSSTDVANGLFIATLILEFTVLSKRLTLEAINFLRGILRSAQQLDCQLPTIPPFKIKGGFSLHVPSTKTFEGNLSALGVKDLIANTQSDDFKLRAVKMALQILNGFCENLNEASHFLILEPFLPLLDVQNFNACLKNSVEPVLNRITALQKKKLFKLVNDKKKPKPLKLYEPKIEEVYTLKKKRSVAKEKEEHDKLLYKYKKEVKGALREIRRDNTFLSKLKFNETKASDRERLKKVKEIFGDAAQQAGDLNKIKRQK